MTEQSPNRAALVFGVLFVVAGTAFLLEQLDVWDLKLRHLAPALLIALGLAVLLGGTRRSSSGG